MTREEFLDQLNICDDTIILNNFSPYADRLSAHDQAQREEIARLSEALEAVLRVLPIYVHGPNPNSPYKDGMNPCYVIGSKEALAQAQAALTKEATHDQ